MSEIDHARRVDWDRKGRARYIVFKTNPCAGRPGYSGGHQRSYTDEYGALVTCGGCDGSGTVRYHVYMAVPEFDAPRPPQGWTPPWVEA